MWNEIVDVADVHGRLIAVAFDADGFDEFFAARLRLERAGDSVAARSFFVGDEAIIFPVRGNLDVGKILGFFQLAIVGEEGTLVAGVVGEIEFVVFLREVNYDRWIDQFLHVRSVVGAFGVASVAGAMPAVDSATATT